MDNAAPEVDYETQELAQVVQSSSFLTILAGLAVVLFIAGEVIWRQDCWRLWLSEAYVFQACCEYGSSEAKATACFCLVHLGLAKQ